MLPLGGAFLRIDAGDPVRFQAFYLDRPGVDRFAAMVGDRWDLDNHGAAARFTRLELPPKLPAIDTASGPMVAIPADDLAPAWRNLPAVARAASAPVVRPPIDVRPGQVPAAVADAFAAAWDAGTGEFGRGWKTAAIRALYGPAAPSGGRAYSDAALAIDQMADLWLASGAGVAASEAQGGSNA